MIGYEDVADGLDNFDGQAVLVEEVGGGAFERYALTPVEFEEKFGQPQVVGFARDGWEAFSVDSADF